jgi:hypothetical protein
MENLELDLKLTVTHINILLKHLGAGAYAEVADLVNILHSQAKPQIAAATVASEPTPEVIDAE